jgi:uncharacterized membrane protein
VLIALLLVAAAYAMCHLFSGRGAFLEFGAMLGTIMVANVYFVIIPGQRQMVQAKRDGREPDPQAGLRGRLRSVHNTYFTLPVLFTMISNHYSITFGARRNWLVLLALCSSGVCIRTYFVSRHKRHERGGKTAPWPALLGVGLLAATAAALAPHAVPTAAGSSAPSFESVRGIIEQRCAPCHAGTPTQPGFAAAPNGVLLDSPQAILAHAAVLGPQIESRSMPIGNLTGMTEDERARVLDWLRHGAPR